MKKHIVIIEHNCKERENLEDILTAKGYRVTAMDGVVTIEELLDLRADCFIIEEHLPVITGHILCMILHSKPETKHIPVILTSDKDGLEKYIGHCNACAHIKKPYNLKTILSLVESVMPDNNIQAA